VQKITIFIKAILGKFRIELKVYKVFQVHKVVLD